MILLIDNYDSFVHNLARYFRLLGCDTVVTRNDAIDAAGAAAMRPEAIVLSPGPGGPSDAGACGEIVRQLHAQFPMLGVCLGHQVIAAEMGAEVVRSDAPMHGRSSLVLHNERRLFNGISSPLEVGRYHSLVVDPAMLPPVLRATALAADGVLMAMEHVSLPIFGLQFHPESILTSAGLPLLANFLRIAKKHSPLPIEVAVS